MAAGGINTHSGKIMVGVDGGVRVNCPRCCNDNTFVCAWCDRLDGDTPTSLLLTVSGMAPHDGFGVCHSDLTKWTSADGVNGTFCLPQCYPGVCRYAAIFEDKIDAGYYQADFTCTTRSVHFTDLFITVYFSESFSGGANIEIIMGAIPRGAVTDRCQDNVGNFCLESSGHIDLSSIGGEAPSCFSGSITQDNTCFDGYEGSLWVGGTFSWVGNAC